MFWNTHPAAGGSGSACCLDSDTCVLTNLNDCLDREGEYLGRDVECPSDGLCLGACCADSKCIDRVSRADCQARGGQYKGSGTACHAATCGGPCASDADCSDGNACNGDERCLDGGCLQGTQPNCDLRNFCTIDTCNLETGCRHTPYDHADCGACCNRRTPCEPALQSFCTGTRYGTFQGAGTTCDSGICVGPCCLNDEECIDVERYECNGHGWFGGIGGKCEDFDCTPSGACCLGDTCQMRDELTCNLSEGSFRGPDSSCDDAGICDGACCFGGGDCSVLSASQCSDDGGLFQGPWLTQCNACSCNEIGACCLPDDQCVISHKFVCEAYYQGTFLGGHCGLHSCSCKSDEDCANDHLSHGPGHCDAGICRGLNRSDFISFMACFEGPEAGIPLGCSCMDRNLDNHIDLSDAAMLFNELHD